jgi:hypothetical protein
MRDVTLRFSFVAEGPSLRGECLGNRQTATLCLGDSAQDRVLETPVACVPSRWYVVTSPEDFRIERGHPSSPPFESADRPLELAVIELE